MKTDCCGENNKKEPFGRVSHLKPFASTPLMQNKKEDAACCGSPPGPECSRFARPGYEICGFVEEFMDTAAGSVPRIGTKLSVADHAMSVLARFGIGRDSYGIAPGIYCTGTPDADSPVLVTANYKLTFDALRKELSSTQRLDSGTRHTGNKRMVRCREKPFFDRGSDKKSKGLRPG